MNRPQVLILLILLASLMTRASITHGQQQLINKEPEIKAGLVAILGKLLTWPPTVAPAAGAPLKIGVLGADPFQQGGVNHLDKRLAGQNVVVERFATGRQVPALPYSGRLPRGRFAGRLGKNAGARRTCHRPIGRAGQTGRGDQSRGGTESCSDGSQPRRSQTQGTDGRSPDL